jgi:hypothetical protein
MIRQSIVHLKPCTSVKLISRQKKLFSRPTTPQYQKIDIRVRNSLYEKEFAIIAHSVVSLSLFFYMICYRYHHLKEFKMLNQDLEVSQKKSRFKNLLKKQNVSK